MNRKSFLATMLGAAGASYVANCSRPHSASTGSSSIGRADQLVDRIASDTNAAYFVTAAYIGDRLGLFKAMAGAGPVTAKQLADKTGLNERYLFEWLRAMASARYIDYVPEPERFELPQEHAAVLVDEDSPVFSAGLIELTVPDVLMAHRVMAAFHDGGGIPYSNYPPETFDGIERLTRPDYRHRLTQTWLPSVQGVVERLRLGGSAADLGSGAGHASIEIARTFPKSRTFGFEPYAPSVARARENARAAGVSERVKFETFDGVHVPGGPYDLITISHSLHHAGDPINLLRSTRQAVAPNGAFLIVEERRSARLDQDFDSARAGYYAIGLLECLPTALAEGGPGYGTGMTEQDVRQLAAASGFREVTRVMPDDALLSFFVLRP